MTVAPSIIPAVTLPTGAAVRKIMTIGQSNARGTSLTYIANQTVPAYLRYLDEKLGTSGRWERLGAAFRDQAVAPGFQAALTTQQKNRGVLTQAALDLTAGGKSPVAASIARSGTAIGYFGPGQLGETAFNTYASEIITDVGATNWHIAILWGESDANSGVLAAAWQANLTAFVAVIRAKFPAARIYLVQLNINLNDSAGGVNRDTIRAANISFVSGDGNAELLDCDAFSYATPHYTDAGCNSIGSLFAARVLVNQP